ncbi:MAG: hypothetical protein LBS75_05190, partial [Synergistaceae bacterium]|nr:hypothetical protein [Synergistaceae bacterium]
VNYYYRIWTKKNEKEESVLDCILAKLVDIERYTAGRNPQPSMLIVDSKSIQNADTEEEKGYDAGKNFWNKSTHSCRRAWVAICGFGNDRQRE